MSKYIRVSQQRFFEILGDKKYIKEEQKGEFEYTSCPYYNVIDKETNTIVGVYSDGSWENTFEIIIDLVSKEDIVAHYDNILKYKDSELKRVGDSNKKLYAYKKLSPAERAKVDAEELAEIERRKTHPGLMEFIDEGNLLPYIPPNLNDLVGYFKNSNNDTKES